MRTSRPCGTLTDHRRLRKGQECRACLAAVARERAAEQAAARLLRLAAAIAASDTAGPGPDEVSYGWYREMRGAF